MKIFIKLIKEMEIAFPKDRNNKGNFIQEAGY